MGKPVNSLITLRAYLAERSSGKIIAYKSWKNRIPLLLIVKLSSWLYALEDEFDPRNYKLLIHVDGDQNDERVKFLVSKLKSLGITLLEEPLAVMA